MAFEIRSVGRSRGWPYVTLSARSRMRARGGVEKREKGLALARGHRRSRGPPRRRGRTRATERRPAGIPLAGALSGADGRRDECADSVWSRFPFSLPLSLPPSFVREKTVVRRKKFARNATCHRRRRRRFPPRSLSFLRHNARNGG